jgi:hypothetical protein
LDLPQARCPKCEWSTRAHSAQPEHLANAVSALEQHLAGDHDMTWENATEFARGWAQRVIAAARDAATR